MAFGIVLAPFLDVARGRSWQQVNRAHLRANQPFDVAAEMGRPRRTPLDLYAVVPASTFECMTTKIRTVVDMYRSGQTGHWPRFMDTPLLQPRGLVEY
ncbi:hypothetical protein [Mesorhizobium sp. AR02]|uniref:hypothetical protein n=1 Tax=Mesorhizobium sp. AR02 TaxID=2865837 RepID=UPI0021605D2A|nr:hypothetical protein [Mesorhizobium sp. AR02]